MKNDFGGSLEEEVEGRQDVVEGNLLEKQKHELSDVNDILTSGVILYLHKQKQTHYEIEFLKNFSEAYGVDLTTRNITHSDSLANISLPCIRIREYLIEKSDIITLLYTVFCQAKKLEDISIKTQFEYLIFIVKRLSQALEYEMWFDSASPYAFRNQIFSFAAPMNTLSNLFRYKLDKDHFGIRSKNQMLEKIRPIVNELEICVQDIRYFKVNEKSIGFADILVYSLLSTVFQNAPSSPLANLLDKCPKISQFYTDFISLKNAFPIEKLLPREEASKEENRRGERAAVSEVSKKHKIITCCVVGAFSLLYLVGGDSS